MSENSTDGRKFIQPNHVTTSLRRLQVPEEKPPCLVIVEQPQARGLRFRYRCEGRLAGSISGEHSAGEQKTAPSVQIKHLRDSSAIIVVSCVSKDEPYHPHPHNLVGQNCQDGVCTLRVTNGQSTCTLQNVGIQCCKRNEVKESLQLRQKIRVDPFSTGFQENLDLSTVRLCFQAFLPDAETRKFSRILMPIVSNQIFDKKVVHDLVICRLSRTAGSVTGGDELFLLCEKVTKDDVEVRFYEEVDGNVRWEGFGVFQPEDVHKQVAIVLKTPPYMDLNISSPVSVHIQLKKRSDNSVISDAKPFIYYPRDLDPDGIHRKRQKMNRDNSSDSHGGYTTTSTSLPRNAAFSIADGQANNSGLSGFSREGEKLEDILRRKTAVKQEDGINSTVDATGITYQQNVAFVPSTFVSVPEFFAHNQFRDTSLFSNLSSTFSTIATETAVFPNIQATYPGSFPGSITTPQHIKAAGHNELSSSAITGYNPGGTDDFCDISEDRTLGSDIMTSFPSGLGGNAPFTGQELVNTLDLIDKELGDSIGNGQQRVDGEEQKFSSEDIKELFGMDLFNMTNNSGENT